MCAGRRFLTKVNANIGNSAVSSSIEEVGCPLVGSLNAMSDVIGGGETSMGNDLGRRYRDGSFDREQYP